MTTSIDSIACPQSISNHDVGNKIIELENSLVTNNGTPSLQSWQDKLKELTASVSCVYKQYDYFAPVMLLESFASQFNFLKDQKLTPQEQQILHGVEILYYGLLLHYDATTEDIGPLNTHKIADNLTVSAYDHLKNILFTDGSIDSNEEIVLQELELLLPEISNAKSTISFLRTNKPNANSKYYSLKYERLNLIAAENKGQIVHSDLPISSELSPPICYDNYDYYEVTSDYPLIQERNTNKECFTFALAKQETLSIDTQEEDLWEYVVKHYEPIDPNNSTSKIGDLVVYANYELDEKDNFHPGIEHMAIVSRLDSNGQPTHVIGKFGLFGKIVEHPINQAPFHYGHLYLIFREK